MPNTWSQTYAHTHTHTHIHTHTEVKQFFQHIVAASSSGRNAFSQHFQKCCERCPTRKQQRTQSRWHWRWRVTQYTTDSTCACTGQQTHTPTTHNKQMTGAPLAHCSPLTVHRSLCASQNTHTHTHTHSLTHKRMHTQLPNAHLAYAYNCHSPFEGRCRGVFGLSTLKMIMWPVSRELWIGTVLSQITREKSQGKKDKWIDCI